MSGREDAEETRRYQKPWTAKHPIPTISKYRQEKAAREEAALGDDYDDSGADDASRTGAEAMGAAASRARENSQGSKQGKRREWDNDDQDDGHALEKDDDGTPKDTSQAVATSDPKQRRKEMKGKKKERAEREVTDPVTHLPITIHDFTDEALKDVDLHEQPVGSNKGDATGPAAKSKSEEQLKTEGDHAQKEHNALQDKFPPPDFDALRGELATITKQGVTVGLGGAALIILGSLAVERALRKDALPDSWGRIGFGGGVVWIVLVGVAGLAVWFLIAAVRDWTSKKLNAVFQDEVWDAQRRQARERTEEHRTETTLWLNSLVGSVWPLINPDLFTSLADTLEDVMQASLPRFIRMVSVDDIGQGSESLRILGVRWLPTGAAAKSVTEDGHLSSKEHYDNDNNGDIGADDDDEKNKDQNDDDKGNDKSQDNSVSQGMQAEEGDFVNLEIAFAYRGRSSSKTLKERTKDMHLYLAFYLPGNIKVPVWVNLQGIIGTVRVRLQLTPDPPFFALCTMTFLGQPKVNLSCIPLSKHALNIMDVPFISNFVQSAVDAAMAEFVAPKSMTLDLKDMLVGDDFKKDTNARGVLMINIKRGYDFKMGDTPIPLISDGASDPYVSVGWAKFGKAIWSTRILISEMEPYWDETCFLLVTPDELNIDERLRLQLWDSDRMSADDDLGRIEVDLKELMKNDNSNGKMWDRTDGFRALKSGDNMPGKLEWSVGYFSKARMQPCQFEQQTYDKDVRNMDQLKEKVNSSSERKLRETMFKEGQTSRDEDELKQLEHQEFKAEQDAMMISAPPPQGLVSGILSVQIHNITGLELENLSKSEESKGDDSNNEEETGSGLPSSFCTIIVNHRKTFKTRTKPHNAKPFFNAGCERFIRDWTNCEVFVAVRDARLQEDDALLGIVHLPLQDVFKDRSQVNGFWPLSGGVGHGRIRLSLVWRSVQLQAPTNLLGWQYGTVEVHSGITATDCPEELRSAKLKFKTNISKRKMRASEDGKWQTKNDGSLSLAVEKRYSSCMSIALKTKGGSLSESTSAFSVLWLKDIPDEKEQEIELPIWKGDFKRATACALEECGERQGTLKLKLSFWPGLGKAHSRWANSKDTLRDVVEVIDTARDNLDNDKMERKAGIVDGDASTDSDSSDDENDEGTTLDGGADDGDSSVPDGSSDHKQGPLDQLKDYKRREEGLHRQQRGMMQWKIPRTAKWMKHKLDGVERRASGVFERHSREAGIETEV